MVYHTMALPPPLPPLPPCAPSSGLWWLANYLISASQAERLAQGLLSPPCLQSSRSKTILIALELSYLQTRRTVTVNSNLHRLLCWMS